MEDVVRVGTEPLDVAAALLEVQDPGAGASAVWRVSENLTFVAFGSYNYLGDIGANSPLVTGPGGSRNQFVVGSALSWRFSW